MNQVSDNVTNLKQAKRKRKLSMVKGSSLKMRLVFVSVLAFVLFIIFYNGDNSNSIECSQLKHSALAKFSSGKYRQAVQFNAKALELCYRQGKHVSFDAIEFYQNLGNSYRYSGAYNNALKYLNLAYYQSQEFNSEYHDKTLEILNDLAIVNTDVGNYKDAVAYYKKLLVVQTAKYGKSDFNTIIVTTNLAGVLRLNGQYDEVERLLVQARLNVGKSDHYQEILSTVNEALAQFYEFRGRWKDALSLYEQIKKYRITALGESHPKTLSVLTYIAHANDYLGNYSLAESGYKSAIESQEKILGKEHPQTVKSLHYLAGLYESLKRYQEAENLYEKVLLLRVSSLGGNHVETLTTQNNLGLVQIYLGRFKKAEKNLQSADSLGTRFHRGHQIQVVTKINFGLLHKAIGNYQKAISFYIDASEQGANSLGKDHYQTLSALYGLAESYRLEGDSFNAKRIYLELIPQVSKLYGDDHDFVEWSRQGLEQLR